MSIGLIENHPKATVVIPVCDDLSNSEIDYVSFLQNRFPNKSEFEK